MGRNVGIVVGSTVAIVGGFLLFRLVRAQMQKTLEITLDPVAPHGTTDPAPGKYGYDYGTEVTITATPDAGYTPGTWLVDGVVVGQKLDSYTVRMDMNHFVGITFWEGGNPPPGTLHHLEVTPMEGENIIQNVGAWWDISPFDITYSVKPFNSTWLVANVPSAYTVQIKACDVDGNGIPDVNIAVYTDDADSSRYFGSLLVDNEAHRINSYRIMKTGSDGIVRIYVNYAYGFGVVSEKGPYWQLMSDGQVRATWLYGPGFPTTDIPFDGLHYHAPLDTIIGWSASGDCVSGQAGCTPPMSPIGFHTLYAKAIDSPSTPVAAYLFKCGFHAKWVAP